MYTRLWLIVLKTSSEFSEMFAFDTSVWYSCSDKDHNSNSKFKLSTIRKLPSLSPLSELCNILILCNSMELQMSLVVSELVMQPNSLMSLVESSLDATHLWHCTRPLLRLTNIYNYSYVVVCTHTNMRACTHKHTHTHTSFFLWFISYSPFFFASFIFHSFHTHTQYGNREKLCSCLSVDNKALQGVN